MPISTLVPGMYANATLTLDESKGVLLVPVQAVDRGDTRSTVMVVNQATPDRGAGRDLGGGVG